MVPGGATFGNLHTYDDLNMIPKSKLVFAPPQPKLAINEKEGADGVLDYTNLFGSVFYENSKGEFRFLVLINGNHAAVYRQMLSLFDGKILTCELDDQEGNVSYVGRFILSEWLSHGNVADMTLSYNVKRVAGGGS